MSTDLVALVHACDNVPSGKFVADAASLQALNKAKDSNLDPKYQLKEHQEMFVKFFLGREEHNKHGGILAHDMGLGKSCTILACIAASKHLRPVQAPAEVSMGGTLLVVPGHLLPHWESQIGKHYITPCALKIKTISKNEELVDLDVRMQELKSFDIVLMSREILKEFKPDERRQSKSDTFEALLGVQWLRLWLDEGHEADKRNNRSLFYHRLRRSFTWIASGTVVDVMRGHRRNIELLLGQIKLLQLPATILGPLQHLANCHYENQLEKVLSGPNAIPALQEIVRCTPKEAVVTTKLIPIDTHVPITAEEQYMAHEQNMIRNVGLNTTYDTKLGVFVQTGDLSGEKQAERRCKSLFRSAVGRQVCGRPSSSQPKGAKASCTAELMYSVPYSDEQLTPGQTSDPAVEKRRADIKVKLREPTIAAFEKPCCECGKFDVKPLITARCDQVVCSSCFTRKVATWGARFPCCQSGCAPSEMKDHNPVAVASLQEPDNDDKDKRSFDHTGERLETTCKTVEDYVRMGRKTVVYVEHKSFMNHLFQELKRKLGVSLVLGAAGGLGQKNKDLRTSPTIRFQEDPKAMVIIISSDGINGLDLSAASVLVLAHPMWPGLSFPQLTSRIHRMGQTETVDVVTLYARDTIEESALKLRDTIQARGLIEGDDAARSGRPCLAMKLLRSVIERVAKARPPRQQQRGRQASNRRQIAASSGAASGNGKGKGRADKKRPRSSASTAGSSSSAPAPAKKQRLSCAPVVKNQPTRELQAVLRQYNLDESAEDALCKFGVRTVAQFWKLTVPKVEYMESQRLLTGSDAFDLREVLKSRPQGGPGAGGASGAAGV